MTNQFVPQNTIGAGFDYLTAGTQPSEKGVAPGQKNTLRLYDQKGDEKYNIGRFEIVVNDFSQQGHNHPEGDFSQHSNGFSWSDLITSSPNELFPPLVHTSYSSPSTSGAATGIHFAFAFNRLFGALGSGANGALWRETSATDPTPTAVTYSPAGAITSLTQTLANGAERLAVGVFGAPVKLMSDAAGTVATTMHTDTNSCWGIILSGINATTAGVPVMLMYCGTSIKTKATDADLTTALVATVPPTTVNAGGFAIGAIKAAGRAQRAYWGIPRVTTSAGALTFSGEVMMDIMSTDMTGSDLLPLRLQYLPNGIRGAVPYRDGIFAWDDTHAVYWDGDNEYDLNILTRRPSPKQVPNDINPDFVNRLRVACVDGPNVYMLWQTYYSPGTQPGSVHLEQYRFESGTWHNTGAIFTITATTAGVNTVLAGTGGAVISPNTRYMFYRIVNDTAYGSYYIPRAAESLLWQNSQGTASSTTGIPLYQSGQLFGCRWWLDEVPPGALPGTSTIRRAPKVITEVEFNGNLDFGGTGLWTFEVQVFGRGIDGTTTLTAYDETFSQGKPSADYKKRNAPNKRANIQDVQLSLIATSSTSRRTIPQLLPFTVRGAYSKDGTPITSLPEDVG